MKRQVTILILGLVLSVFVLGALAAPGASAAPVLASPSPRPTLTPGTTPQPATGCQQRVFDDLVRLVVFRCPDGSLEFYRLESGQGQFHSAVAFKDWALAAEGAQVIDRPDGSGHALSFQRLSAGDAEARGLTARTPHGREGAWYRVRLLAPGGGQLVDADFFLPH